MSQIRDRRKSCRGKSSAQRKTGREEDTNSDDSDGQSQALATLPTDPQSCHYGLSKVFVKFHEIREKAAGIHSEESTELLFQAGEPGLYKPTAVLIEINVWNRNCFT